MQSLSSRTVREIALETPATVRVFEEFKIDYCCGGRRSIADACSAAGVDASVVSDRIEAVVASPSPETNSAIPERMEPAGLVGHILATHHVFTASEIERLTPLMAKVAVRHGDHHPELLELQKLFTELTESLTPHMRKEENVLFPYILSLSEADKREIAQPPPHFGTVRNPIKMMMMEHDSDGARLEKMRSIANDYRLPPDACPSFTALYAGLQDLERDLHRHIHLENNVLFPAAADLEEKVVG